MPVEARRLAALLLASSIPGADGVEPPSGPDPAFLEYLASFGEGESIWEGWIDEDATGAGEQRAQPSPPSEEELSDE